MPTKLEKGIVTLHSEYTVCEEGRVLTPEQAKILKLLEKPMAYFTLTLKCFWNKKKGYMSFVDDDDVDEETENKKKAITAPIGKKNKKVKETVVEEKMEEDDEDDEEEEEDDEEEDDE